MEKITEVINKYGIKQSVILSEPPKEAPSKLLLNETSGYYPIHKTESIIGEIDFEFYETIVEFKAPKNRSAEKNEPLQLRKINELKSTLATTKKNKMIYREIFEETKKECPHPTLMMIYCGYKYLEKIENQRRKPRKRKGLKNKPKYSLSLLLK